MIVWLLKKHLQRNLGVLQLFPWLCFVLVVRRCRCFFFFASLGFGLERTHVYTHTCPMSCIPFFHSPRPFFSILSPFFRSLPFFFILLPSFLHSSSHSLPPSLYFLSTRGPTLSPHFLLCSVCEPSHKGKVLLRQHRHMATTPFLSFFIKSSMSVCVFEGGGRGVCVCTRVCAHGQLDG
jgi:hypothetical protein